MTADDFYDDDLWDDDGPYHDDAFYVHPDNSVWGLLDGDGVFRDPQVRAAHQFHDAPTWSVVESVLTRLFGFAALSPLGAVRAWLGYEFGAGEIYDLDEELALCTAVRRDPSVTLSDDTVFDIFDAALLSGDYDDATEARLDEQAADMLARLRTLSTRRR